MITSFVKMWITENQSSFTRLFSIGKFLNQINRACCTTKYPTTRLGNELCRHAILGIVRNSETWVLDSYFMNWNISFLNKISISIELITWLYIGAVPLSLKYHTIDHNFWSWEWAIAYIRDQGTLWFASNVNSLSDMKFIIIWTLLHSSLLPLHQLGN